MLSPATKKLTKIAIIDMGRINDQRAGTARHVSNAGGVGGRNFGKGEDICGLSPS
jgi:hypothetical protein